jgi:predicted DCC family thiol-disulfide oxidoreductase YuxK
MKNVEKKHSHPTDSIVFFDGVCTLCNIFIDLLFRLDKKQVFLVASLQGETFRQVRGTSEQKLDSIVLWHQGQFYYKSEAVIKICSLLGGIWNLATLAKIIPLVLRDAAYDFVARNRYKWFGQKETCRVPNTEEKAKFLN